MVRCAGKSHQYTRRPSTLFRVDTGGGFTPVVQELFDSPGTLNSGNPGNLGAAITGDWPKSPGGPIGPSGRPWSALLPARGDVSDGDPLNVLTWDLTSAPYNGYAGAGYFSTWFKFTGVGSTGTGSNPRYLLGYMDDHNGGINDVPHVWTCETPHVDNRPGVQLTVLDYFTPSAPLIVPFDTWVYLAIAWREQFWPNQFGSIALNYYKMVVGEDAAPVLYHNSNSGKLGAAYALYLYRYRAYSTTDMWGRMGPISLYGMTVGAWPDMGPADTMPTGVRPPVDQRRKWYVNPEKGDDDNPGDSPGRAWATWGKLKQEVEDGSLQKPIVPWIDQYNEPADLTTLADAAARSVWMDAYLLGNRRHNGDCVVVDTSVTPLQLTDKIDFSRNKVGLQSSTTALADIRVNLPLEDTWTRPDSGTYPHVWGTAGTTYTGAFVYEKQSGLWAQLKPIAAADLTAAKPLLEAETVTGAFWWASDGKIYIRAVAGGNPNSDGVEREYSPNYTGGFDTQIISMGDGELKNVQMDGGVVYDAVGGTLAGQYIGATDLDAITAFNNCVASRYGKHGFGSVGNGNTGVVLYTNCDAQYAPGGIFSGNYTSFVDFSGSGGDGGSIVSGYFNCRTSLGVLKMGLPGVDTTLVWSSMYSHNAGGSAQYALRRIEDCTFNAGILGGAETVEVHLLRCTWAWFPNIYEGIGAVVADQCKFGTYLSDLKAVTASFTNCIFTVGGEYVSASLGIQGVVNFNRCTFDLTAASGTSGTWARSGNLDLTITNSALLLGPYGLVSGFDDGADMVAVDHSAIQGATSLPFMVGSTDADTVAHGISNGQITTSVTSADLLLNAGSDYAVGASSPVIGVATAGTNVKDYTGTLFGTRNDAGARER